MFDRLEAEKIFNDFEEFANNYKDEYVQNDALTDASHYVMDSSAKRVIRLMDNIIYYK